MNSKPVLEKQKLTVKKVFFEKESGFIIASTDDEVNIQGNIHHTGKELEGETLELIGTFKEHKTHGRSFHFTHYTILGNYGLFFLTKVVGGISKASAQEILSKCGNRLDEIIDKHPSTLLTVKGIGEKKLEKIVKKFKENKPISELFELLGEYGVTVVRVKKIHEYFLEKKMDAIATLKKNPYLLIKMDGMGFKRADHIALRMNQEPGNAFRIQNGIQYSIEKECYEKGHTYVTISGLYEIAKEILDLEPEPNAVYEYEQKGFSLSRERYMVEIDDLLASEYVQKVDQVGDKISIPKFIRAENYIAETLRLYANEPRGMLHSNIEYYITEAEKQAGFSFGDSQKEAIRLGNRQYPIFYMYGRAGSGKTTISKYVLQLFANIYGESQVVCTSLSGVAANKAYVTTGFKGYTIHSLLAYKGGEGFQYNEENKLPYSAILLDEATMADSWLFYSLLKAIDFEKTSLFMVGDPSQLASVGSGSVFTDLINKSEHPPYIIQGCGLLEVYRQRPEQMINVFATEYIRKGLVPEGYKENCWEDFKFVPVEIPNFWAKKKTCTKKELVELKTENNQRIIENIKQIASRYANMHELYLTDIKKYISWFQVITPQKIGELGTWSLNKHIQSVLNPKAYKNTLHLEDKMIKPRDKVIHLKNKDKKCCSTENWKNNRSRLKEYVLGDLAQKRIYNGMIGVVVDIDLEADIISVFFPNEEVITFYKKEDFNKGNIDMAFSTTCHKSQGSQYETVVGVYTSSHYMMHTNQLTYTTVTRAKDMFYGVGNCYAFEKGCKEVATNKRNTILSLLS